MSYSVDEQLEILMHGAVFGDEQTGRAMRAELRERLQLGRPLRVYLGVDPTAPDIHLGHTVPLRKLAQFQALGHQAIFLIGSFTALIGDPSDKDKARPQLGDAAIAHNVKTYTDQAWKLLDPRKTEVRYNSEWLSELGFADIIRLASNFTVAQFLQRDNFAKRYSNNDPIFLHEFFYALMQGYDAVALQSDVQLGGTDQTFNILAGRKLQEAHNQRPQVMLTTPMLPGTDGTVKMSKSIGNAIGIFDTPEDMYGKLMSIPDHAMGIYFDLLSRFHPSEIRTILGELTQEVRHPRDVKMLLAREITEIFNGSEGAARAEEHFRTVFQRGDRPSDVPVHTLTEATPIVDLLVALGFAASRSEARRLIQQGGVSLDDAKIEESDRVLNPGTGGLLRVGKRKFVELQ